MDHVTSEKYINYHCDFISMPSTCLDMEVVATWLPSLCVDHVTSKNCINNYIITVISSMNIGWSVSPDCPHCFLTHFSLPLSSSFPLSIFSPSLSPSPPPSLSFPYTPTQIGPVLWHHWYWHACSGVHRGVRYGLLQPLGSLQRMLSPRLCLQ